MGTVIRNMFENHFSFEKNLLNLMRHLRNLRID